MCDCCRKLVHFLSFACYCPVFPPTFVEQTALLLIGYSFLLCWRLIDHLAAGLSLFFFFILFNWSLCVLLCQYHTVLITTAFYLFIFHVYLFWRERERNGVSRGGIEREGDIESEADSRLQAVSTEPNVGLKHRSLEIMTWAEVRHLTH